MKYTVVIRQPVPDEVRPNLEKELLERFGLNEQQAERLAGRRAGRLLKPTTQARADLLMRVYQSVGAQVLMEEIPEETDAPSQAFRAAPAVDDAILAPPMKNDASLADFMSGGGSNLVGEVDAFSPAGVLTPSDDPFAATFAPVTDPSPTEPLPDWAVRDPNVPPDNNPAINLLGGPSLSAGASASEAAIARELKGVPATTAVADDWADFAGGLNLPETAAPAQSAPRTNTEFLTAVTEDAAAQNLPRTTLTNQIRWGTLLPVALSSLLTLGLLALSLPSQQNKLTADAARSMATLVGSTLESTAQPVSEAQWQTMIGNPDVGFVRVETPDGKSYVHSKNAAQNETLNKQLTEWTKAHPDNGRINVGGKSYMVSRVAFVKNAQGELIAAPNQAGANSNLVRQVSVGVSNQNSANALRNILLLTGLSTIIGLLLASLLAQQAARRIVQPISDLVKVADAISLGDLTRPVKVSTNDEIGDLAQALERMRLSLEAAMDRMRRRKRG